MKNQREARPKQSEMTSDHIQECLALSELQAAHPVEKKQEVSRPDGVTNKMLTHLGNSAICKLLQI